jgi:hypothetical protein
MGLVLFGRGFGGGGRGNVPSQSTAENAGETSPESVIYRHFNGAKPFI